MTKLMKIIKEGERVQIIGHLDKTHTHMGESRVIDLRAKISGKDYLRMIDHRSI